LAFSIGGSHFQSSITFAGAVVNISFTGFEARTNAGVSFVFDPARVDRQRITVLVIVPTLCVGGAETDLVRNLPLIDRSRFEIIVCTFLDRGALARQLSEAGIEIIGPFSNSTSRWFSFLRSARRRLGEWLGRWRSRSGPEAWLKRLTSICVSSVEIVIASTWAYRMCVRPIAQHIRLRKIDVVHAILPNSYLYGAWANWGAGRNPLLFSRVSLNWYHESAPLLSFLERYALHPHISAAICNSETIARELQAEGIPRSKVRVIYNGIDVPHYSSLLVDRRRARKQIGVAQGDLVFSSVGNLFAYKGHSDLLHALHKISEKLPRAWTLLIVGRDVDGNLARLEGLCTRLNLVSHVRFLGERLDVPTILSAADIHVSASHTEGFPNNILEAMCSRLPVVATAVGGVPELVVSGVTGLLVSGQDADALGVALLTLANDGKRRVCMGRAGHERAKANFSIQRSVAALEDIYQAVFVEHPRPSVKKLDRPSRHGSR
jgi:glycosyltransferase involved in cell wall biosynthesis